MKCVFSALHQIFLSLTLLFLESNLQRVNLLIDNCVIEMSYSADFHERLPPSCLSDYEAAR